MPLPAVDEETRLAAEAMAAGSFEGQTASVRARKIQWESYERAKLIEKVEADMIVQYDRDPAGQGKLLAEKGREYASLFLSLLTKLSNDEAIQYLLTMIDDQLTADPLRVGLFHAVGASDPSLPYSVFLHLILNKDDAYIQNKAVKILSALVLTGRQLDSQSCEQYMKWLAAQLKKGDPNTIQTLMRHSLMELLRQDYYRQEFYNTANGVDALCDLVTARAANFQMQYQVVFCLWCLSFNHDIAANLSKYHVQRVVAQILAKTSKEKVVRVACSTLKNLLTQPDRPTTNAELMISNGLLKTLRSLQNKNWKDEDLQEDLKMLVEKLDECVQDMSSYDEYVAEIKSGDIKWSAVHKSEGFWRENIMRFNDDNREMLRLLIAQLEESHDPVVLAVCSHDLGEYVRHYQRGRGHVEELGGKKALISLMQHGDSSVRYEALVAIQKMMVQNWHFLNKQAAAPEKPGK
eukprot:comp12158_c0_seq1/m.6911 comp12158_c0_seq1/g.6911  ORF comp12158_c0_seq1/g.6911 comp12158_c0_seq1/m.6911 type:complete len:463 (-) comp12158_c0_seq1:757-2145(-)